jgi:hypothetical protein
MHAIRRTKMNDCGCNEGALGILLTLSIYLTSGILWPFLTGRSPSATWIGAVGAVALGGVTGKIIGMLLARRAHGSQL